MYSDRPCTSYMSVDRSPICKIVSSIDEIGKDCFCEYEDVLERADSRDIEFEFGFEVRY